MTPKYKIGDRIKIKSLDWYNKHKDMNGNVRYGCNDIFNHCTARHCGQVLTIKHINCLGWYEVEEEAVFVNDGMIERLVERNGKTYPYKIGDRVVLKGSNRCATITDLKYNSSGNLSYYIKIDNDKDISIDYPTDLLLPYDNMIECKVGEEMKSEDKLLDEYEELTDRAFKGGYEKCKSDIELNGFQLPDGYIFKDENGNVINTTKIVLEKKKKEYPKTYEECCRVLGVSEFEYNHTGTNVWYKHKLMSTLDKLILCRNAYWKLYGEEMGLGKPWESDWRHINRKFYCIYNFKNNIVKNVIYSDNKILAFPTGDMRNIFYENFKELIEQCKELL